MHTVFALLYFVVVIHWLIFPYPSGLLHWHCGNLTIAPVPAKQPWWIWINISCEFIMNDCITTTKQSTTKPCAYFLGYTVTVTLQGLVCTSSCDIRRRSIALPTRGEILWRCRINQASCGCHVCSGSVQHIQAHDDVIKWKHFPCFWPFVRGIHRSTANSPHKGQWYGTVGHNDFFLHMAVLFVLPANQKPISKITLKPPT